MAEKMDSGGGLSVDKLVQALKQVGLGDGQKSSKKTLDIQVNTEKSVDNVLELKEAVTKMWDSLTKGKDKAKYFQSIENASADVIEAWNNMVSKIETDKKNGVFNIDDLYSTKTGSKQTELLRYANAFEAMGGKKLIHR